jgi:hypothetical protein
MAVETTFKIDEPTTLKSTTGLYPDIFNDDLAFTFEAKNFHTTDAKEVKKVFADLDSAIVKVKKSWGQKLQTAPPPRG